MSPNYFIVKGEYALLDWSQKSVSFESCRVVVYFRVPGAFLLRRFYGKLCQKLIYSS